MHELEHKGDEINHAIFKTVATDFITPIEREDIINMSQYLDNIIDYIEDVMQRFYMYDVHFIHHDVLEFAHLIKKSCVALDKAMEDFRNFKKSKMFKQLIIDVNDYEEEADQLYMTVIRKLHTHDRENPMRVLVWSQIFDRMEKCCDSCEHAADTMNSILLKNVTEGKLVEGTGGLTRFFPFCEARCRERVRSPVLSTRAGHGGLVLASWLEGVARFLFLAAHDAVELLAVHDDAVAGVAGCGGAGRRSGRLRVGCGKLVVLAALGHVLAVHARPERTQLLVTVPLLVALHLALKRPHAIPPPSVPASIPRGSPRRSSRAAASCASRRTATRSAAPALAPRRTARRSCPGCGSGSSTRTRDAAHQRGAAYSAGPERPGLAVHADVAQDAAAHGGDGAQDDGRDDVEPRRQACSRDHGPHSATDRLSSKSTMGSR